MTEADFITGKCPSCGVTFRVPWAMRGKRGKCPKCGEVLEVPMETAGATQAAETASPGLADSPFPPTAAAGGVETGLPAGQASALPNPDKTSAFWLMFGILGGAALTVLIAAGGVLLWLLLRPQPVAQQPAAPVPATPAPAAEPAFDPAVAEATSRFWEDFQRNLATLEGRSHSLGAAAGPSALVEGTALRQAADEIAPFLAAVRNLDRTNVDPQALQAVDEAIQTLTALGARLSRTAETMKQWSAQQQKMVLDLSMGQIPEGGTLPGLDNQAMQGVVNEFAEIVRQAQDMKAKLSATAEQLSARYQRPFTGAASAPAPPGGTSGQVPPPGPSGG